VKIIVLCCLELLLLLLLLFLLRLNTDFHDAILVVFVFLLSTLLLTHTNFLLGPLLLTTGVSIYKSLSVDILRLQDTVGPGPVNS